MTIRISGMSSGMDIDKIVSDLMKAERIPQDKLRQKKDILSFQTDLYREINTKLAAFRDSVNAIRFSSTMSPTKASSTSSAVSVSSGNNAAAINHTIEVIALATGAAQSSTAAVSVAGLAGSSALAATTVIDDNSNKFSMTVDGVTRSITLTNGSYTAAQLQQEVQSKLDTAFGANKVTATLDGSNVLSFEAVGAAGYKPQVIVTEGNGALAKLQFTNNQSYKLNINAPLSDVLNKFQTPLQDPGAGTHDFKINGQTITYTSTDTIQSIMNKVNSSAAGVNMSYDSVSDKFTFTSKTTGSAAQVDLENGTAGNFVSAIKMSTTAVTGTDATVKVDGVTSQRSSNTFTLDGVTYTLNSTTTAPVTIGVTADVDSIVTNIKKFTDAYNDLIDLVNTRLSEKRDQSYQPLTNDQKEAMSESDITLWEGKVKNGLLQNDSLLKGMKNSLRGVITKSVPNVNEAYNSLYEIGITTTAYVKGNSADAGKLTIDETKLRNAISADPDAVKQMFTNNSTVDSEKGIAVDFYDKANTLISDVIKRAGRVGGAVNDVSTSIGNRISNLELQISKMSDSLTRKENFYYSRFAAMEKAVTTNNNQLAWLQQQMG